MANTSTGWMRSLGGSEDDSTKTVAIFPPNLSPQDYSPLKEIARIPTSILPALHFRDFVSNPDLNVFTMLPDTLIELNHSARVNRSTRRARARARGATS